MNQAVRISQVLAWAVGWMACSFPRPPELAGPEDAQVVDASGDSPRDAIGSDGPGSDAPAPPQMLSCAQVPANCGFSGRDNCCTSPEVPGGMFSRNYDVVGDSQSNTPDFPATISEFRLDKYDVTVGRFRIFVNAGQGTQAKPPAAGAGAHMRIPGSGWDSSWNTSLPADPTALMAAVKCNTTYQTWIDVPAAANERLPMNCITWYEAMAFCIWDGGYLPTETEWDYAAAGGNEQRAYPWSSPPHDTSIDSTRASCDDTSGCCGSGDPTCGLSNILEVGLQPAGDSRWGQSDLDSNVLNWTLDRYASSYTNPCVDCANITADSADSYRVLRGGSFVVSLRLTFRESPDPLYRGFANGIRCARAP
jgi:formylglycine-generating enzyme required for sulfatase activity